MKWLWRLLNLLAFVVSIHLILKINPHLLTMRELANASSDTPLKTFPVVNLRPEGRPFADGGTPPECRTNQDGTELVCGDHYLTFVGARTGHISKIHSLDQTKDLVVAGSDLWLLDRQSASFSWMRPMGTTVVSLYTDSEDIFLLLRARQQDFVVQLNAGTGRLRGVSPFLDEAGFDRVVAVHRKGTVNQVWHLCRGTQLWNYLLPQKILFLDSEEDVRCRS
jgi:hypothetical protein